MCLTWESRNEALRVEPSQFLMTFAACERGYMVDRSMWDLHQVHTQFLACQHKHKSRYHLTTGHARRMSTVSSIIPLS